VVVFAFIGHDEHARIIESALDVFLRRAALHATALVIAPAKSTQQRIDQLSGPWINKSAMKDVREFVFTSDKASL
jgi:hypothetical protein